MSIFDENFQPQEKMHTAHTPITALLSISFSAILALSFGFLVYAFNNLASFHGLNLRASGVVLAPLSIPRFTKWEATIPYGGHYINPNDPNEVNVTAIITAPSGEQLTIPGFYAQNFTLSGNAQKEILTPKEGQDMWKIRFAPREIGNYQYLITLKDSFGSTSLGTGSFLAIASTKEGFVRSSGLHLQFDIGTSYTPIGFNAPGFQNAQTHPGISWGDGIFGVDNMNAIMEKTGANYYAFWTCMPNSSINIGCNQAQDKSSAIMDQSSSYIIDHMVDTAQLKNFYLMPTLKHYDQENFTQADHIKNRYFVARWGYATNILMWNWNREGATNASSVRAWAKDMASLDPYHHLRTTTEWNHYPTISNDTKAVYQSVFQSKDIDIVQNHDYYEDCSNGINEDPGWPLFLEKQSQSDPRAFARFGKPSFISETGLTSQTGKTCLNNGGEPSSLYEKDHSGLILKSEIWNTYMSTIGALAAWDFRFDPGCFTQGSCKWNQLNAFRGIGIFAKEVGQIPDDAALISNDQLSSFSTNDQNLHIIGRKNPHFAVLYFANKTGFAGNALRGKIITPIINTAVSLKEVAINAMFTINWYNTDSGVLFKTEQIKSNGSNLSLQLPGQLLENTLAAYITSSLPVTKPIATIQVKLPFVTPDTQKIVDGNTMPCEKGANCRVQESRLQNLSFTRNINLPQKSSFCSPTSQTPECRYMNKDQTNQIWQIPLSFIKNFLRLS